MMPSIHKRRFRGRWFAAFSCAIVPIAACGGNSTTETVEPGPVGPDFGAWTIQTPLPTARQEMPSVLIAGRIYVPGGFTAQGQAATVMEIYDVTARTWSLGPSLPQGRHHPAITAANGKLYVMGGYGDAFGATNTVYEFDPASLSWSTRRVMPAARGAAVAVEV